jgi:hypothetical protein
MEEQSIDSMIKSIRNNIYKEVHNIQTANTQVIAPLHRTTPDFSVSNLRLLTIFKILLVFFFLNLKNIQEETLHPNFVIQLTLSN